MKGWEQRLTTIFPPCGHKIKEDMFFLHQKYINKSKHTQERWYRLFTCYKSICFMISRYDKMWLNQQALKSKHFSFLNFCFPVPENFFSLLYSSEPVTGPHCNSSSIFHSCCLMRVRLPWPNKIDNKTVIKLNIHAIDLSAGST